MAVDVHRTIDAIWRIESARVVARLARMTGDVGTAEELAQDALVAALERWPTTGVPDNPGAWLMATGRNRAVDLLRRAGRFDVRQQEIARAMAEKELRVPDLAAAVDDGIKDDLLRLMFVSCHPVLSTEARVALTLRLVGGLTTAEIARAYLAPEPTIAQRIVRAKRTLSEAGVPFEVPKGADLAERLGPVLGVLYLVFNEGYAATAGDDWLRPELCNEALRLGRILAELAPGEPEVHGLVALMELNASRARARVAADGSPVLLLDQDRSRWDRVLVLRGLAGLNRAVGIGPTAILGPYVLQAAIAGVHARARTAAETNWTEIVALYAALARVAPSPVVELNRAVAVSQLHGPAAGLAVLNALPKDALPGYHLLPAVRADLLAKLGRVEEARAELAKAAELTQNRRERELLLARARAL